MKKLISSKFLICPLALLMAISIASCAAAPGFDLGSKNEAPEGNYGDNIGDYGDVENGGVKDDAPNETEAEEQKPSYDVNQPNKVPPNYGMAGDAIGEAYPMPPAVESPEQSPDYETPGNSGEAESGTEAVGDDEYITESVDTPTFVENPFVSTSENKISTFSADVDTASYSYFRKLVNGGYGFKDLKNGGSAFRTEEFINYFKYNAAEPQNGEIFGVHSELTTCPWNAETLLLRVTLQTEIPTEDKANNLVFLIDVSGSMSSRDKLPLLKTAFSYLVSNLDGNDTVSIVTYSGKEAVVLDGCNGLDSDKIMSAINSLTASGSTNGEAGLTMAYQIAEKHFKADGNNRIIMASDGDLNVGISSADQLTSYIEEKRDQGVYLSVLGFGTGNYQDANMEALADNGNGVYYYIDGETEAEKVFGSDLLGTLYTVAEDVKLQLEFNDERVEAYRLIGYENRKLANEDFENDKKDAGEVGASHQVTVCYEIKLADLTGKDFVDAPVATLRVRYKKPGESLSLLNEYMVHSYSSRISDDQKFIGAVIETCMLLHNSQYANGLTLGKIYNDIKDLDLGGDSYKEEFRKMIKAFADAEAPADVDDVITPEDITESPDGSCDKDSGMVSEGRLYFSGTKSQALLVCENGTLTWLYCEKGGVFDDFVTGDLVRVAHGYVMESWPGQTYISQIALIEEGDIYSFSDLQWEMLTGVFADPPER